MDHYLGLILIELVGPALLAVFGWFARRAIGQIDKAAAERWDHVHERLDELASDFHEERKDIRDTVSDLARVQGSHERWAREVLTRMTSRVSRIEGRLRIKGDSSDQ